MTKEAKGLKPTEIRTLTIGDYDAIIDLWKRAGLPFKPKGRDSEKTTEKQMKAFPEFFIGAFQEKKLVGVTIASYDGRMKGWINRLAVDPEYRRRGIAGKLIQTAEKTLENHGATIFCALIEIPNEESLSLFQKMGYTAHRDILYISKRKSEAI